MILATMAAIRKDPSMNGLTHTAKKVSAKRVVESLMKIKILFNIFENVPKELSQIIETYQESLIQNIEIDDEIEPDKVWDLISNILNQLHPLIVQFEKLELLPNNGNGKDQKKDQKDDNTSLLL